MKKILIHLCAVLAFLGFLNTVSVNAGCLPYNIGHIEDFLNNSKYFNGWMSVDEMDFSGQWYYTAIGFESGNINITHENSASTFTTQNTSNFGTFESINFDAENLYFEDSNGPYNVMLNPYTNNHYFEVYKLTNDSNILSFLPNPISLSANTIIVGFNDNGWKPDGDSDYDDIIIALSPAPVPEPATMILMGLGLLGIAGLGRKKMQQ